MSMRVRVRFRYRADTGEVEVFTVDAVGADATEADHDRRHDAATASVARVVENNAQIDEITDAMLLREPVAPEGDRTQDEHGPRREEPRRG
jgi:hypothetical protein